MNFEDVRLFLLVAEQQSFRKAAEAAQVDPPVVSRKVKRLETVLKTRLFARTTRNVSLTKSGKHYYDSIRPVVCQFDSINSSLSGQASPYKPTIQVQCPSSFGQCLLTTALAKFTQSFPSDSYQVLLDLTDNSQIQQPLPDIVISVGEEMRHDRYATSLLSTTTQRVYASPSLLKSHGPVHEPADLKKFPALVLDQQGFSQKNWTFKQQGKQQKVKVNTFYKSSNALALHKLAQEGAGIVLSTDWVVQKSDMPLTTLFEEYEVSSSKQDIKAWLSVLDQDRTQDVVLKLAEFLKEIIGSR